MTRFWIVLWALVCTAGLGIYQGGSLMAFGGTASQAADESAAKLTLSPGNQVKQGSILVVRLETPSDHMQPDAVATLDGKSSRFYEQAPQGHPVSPDMRTIPVRSAKVTYEALFGISVDDKPGLHTLTAQNGSGDLLASTAFTVIDAKFPRQNITVSKSTEGLKPLPGELESVQALKDTNTPIRYWTKPLMSPTVDCENSPFGVKRYHNGVYIHDYHKGVDLRSPYGRPIRAIADGVVKIAAPFRLHGGTVGLDHGQGLDSIYIHMSKIAVKPGDKVKKGDTVGYVGSTGFATGPHLHWGLYANGVPVNPDLWIPVPRCS